MARTQKIIMNAAVTEEGFIPPSELLIEKKNEWLRGLVTLLKDPADKIGIKITWEIWRDEVQKQKRFINGIIPLWYAIQNDDMIDGLPVPARIKQYRKDILWEVLGYEEENLITGGVRRERKSTTDIKTVDANNELIATIQETLFEPNGYEFPDSAEFWKLAEDRTVGYGGAQKKLIANLQRRLKKRLCE